MKKVRLYEQFISEELFRTYSKLIGYEYAKFQKAFKALHRNNVVVYDEKEDVSYGIRKGSKEALWKYFHHEGRVYHSEKDRDVLGLLNAFNTVKKDHPWS